jgi:NAD(P)-dependent dehydrogenase (short-subunit alcohol dehydrogenase family)
MRRILITGASRGLGLEFTRQYLGRGAHVFAGCRRPEAAQRLQTLWAAQTMGHHGGPARSRLGQH